MSTYILILEEMIFFVMYEEAWSEVLYRTTESTPRTEDRASYFHIQCAH
jgi:hypothetical protein